MVPGSWDAAEFYSGGCGVLRGKLPDPLFILKAIPLQSREQCGNRRPVGDSSGSPG